jgi:hypothetical protein
MIQLRSSFFSLTFIWKNPFLFLATAPYFTQNPIELEKYPWFISTCSKQFDANQILKNCQTIEVNINSFFFIELFFCFRMEIFSFVTAKIKIINIL